MQRNNVTWGIILIAAGIIWALGELGLIPGGSFLFILAGAFFIAYFAYRKSLGFLLPGCIMAAVGVNNVLDASVKDFYSDYFLLILGAAFFAIFLIHTIHIKSGNWGEKYWPIFPGASMILTGLIVMATREDRLGNFVKYSNVIIPVILIIIGGLILLKKPKRMENTERRDNWK